MNTNNNMMNRTTDIHQISPEALAVLGGGKLAYVKTIRSEDVQKHFPQAPELAPGSMLYALHAADGYPPYNIERLPRDERDPERLRITLAVAGFTREQLDVTTEENQLVIRGRQQDDKAREYLHRGIAARQFQRTFVLADGIEVLGADLKNGLLSIDLARPEPERVIKTINIRNEE